MKTFFANRKMATGLITVFFLVIGSGSVHAQSMPSAMMETLIYSQYGNVKPEAFHRVFEQWQKAEYGRVRNSFDQSEVKNVAQSFTLWVVYNDPFTDADLVKETEAQRQAKEEAQRKAAAEKQAAAAAEEERLKSIGWRGVVVEVKNGGRMAGNIDKNIYIDLNEDGKADVFFYTSTNSEGIKVGSVIYVRKEVWSPGTSTQTIREINNVENFRAVGQVQDVLKIYPPPAPSQQRVSSGPEVLVGTWVCKGADSGKAFDTTLTIYDNIMIFTYSNSGNNRVLRNVRDFREVPNGTTTAAEFPSGWQFNSRVGSRIIFLNADKSKLLWNDGDVTDIFVKQ